MRIEQRIWNCYDEVGSTALRHGYLEIADAMFSASVEEAQRNRGDSALLARSCCGLAATYQRCGRSREAMHFYRKAIANFERSQDFSSNWLASSCENLGILHISEGTFYKAKTLLKRALAMYQKTFGENHPVLIPSIVHLGYIYSESNQADKAIHYYRRAKEIERSTRLKTLTDC